MLEYINCEHEQAVNETRSVELSNGGKVIFSVTEHQNLAGFKVTLDAMNAFGSKRIKKSLTFRNRESGTWHSRYMVDCCLNYFDTYLKKELVVVPEPTFLCCLHISLFNLGMVVSQPSHYCI